MDTKQLQELARQMEAELTQNILPFWMNHMVDRDGEGFIGQITGRNHPEPDAPRGAVMYARILWTFAAAYRVLGNPEYLATAQRAKEYISRYFIDAEHGGVYWSLDSQGRPLDTKKQVYAIGFALYGYSEYFRATGDREVLDVSIRLFRVLEQHAYDPVAGGYYEAFARHWGAIEDMRLSSKDSNEPKTMNTHLHILEPYANLYRVWKNPLLGQRLRKLIELFRDRILDKETGHLGLFFADNWQRQGSTVSYGHDIEASWLLHEAAMVLGDEQLLRGIEPVVKQVAAAAAEGLQPDGSLIYEYDPQAGHCDMERHWWPQAEAVVGYMNLCQHFADEGAGARAGAAWRYIQGHLIDKQAGEWYWSVLANGEPNLEQDKAGFWKCPYHNGRMCLEVIERNVMTMAFQQ